MSSHMSNTAKGILLEKKVLRRLRQADITCQRTGGRGNNEIDIRGEILNIEFVVQVKNWQAPVGEFSLSNLL